MTARAAGSPPLKHEVAERQLFGGEKVGDALVDILVVAAEQRQLGAGGEANRVGLRESPAARRHEHDRRRHSQRVDGLEERLGLHDHPGAAAVRIVVDRAMAVVREIAKIDDAIVDSAGVARARGNAQAERRRRKTPGRS